MKELMPTLTIRRFLRRKGILTQQTPPKIGYKQAFIKLSKIDAETKTLNIMYQGVVGKFYSGKDEKLKHRFHMFNSFDKAEKHSQQGNVILEVLSYGLIEEYELGYISTGQRVLQIIVPVDRMQDLPFEVFSGRWTDQHKNPVVFSLDEDYVGVVDNKLVSLSKWKPTTPKVDILTKN